MTKIQFYFFLQLIFGNFLFSQSSLSSPYSIFGLGTLYDGNSGSLPANGNSGIALPTESYINNLNPASLSFQFQNHFLFDVGTKTVFTTYQNSTTKETRNNFQFSHLSFAFALNNKSGVSLSLKPYSSAAYTISNYELPILDSQEKYLLTAKGTGGINNLELSYGRKLNSRFSVGGSAIFLFGSTKDNREYTISNALTTINISANYNGIRTTIGAQFKVDSTLVIGLVLKSPSIIHANKVQSVTILNTSGTSTIEDGATVDVKDFYLPLEIGFGVNKNIQNKYNLSLDYTRSLWANTNQSSIYGEYSNQNQIAFGLSYSKNKMARSYLDRMTFSTGVNLNSGFLVINNQKISSKAVSLGFSLPYGYPVSNFNFSYSYGQNARIGNNLIKENFHKIGLNFSLDNFWFVKRKFE